MSKKRNWSDDYVRFGFTLVMGKDSLPKAQCILCSTVFANTSLKPSKLEPHFLKHGGEEFEGNDLESPKNRSRLNADADLRIALSNTEPRITKIVDSKQQQKSH
ncbi:protein ZBED8-like [Galendromus occidentalis]|uniref:Protein ZBED8-like n=1 Tax=Galendromus occidentalis TaxID=34638 RepID=A0AAJ7L856_9ACAR|nr:protein ZBED8-like [Galendromus occidentalis]